MKRRQLKDKLTFGCSDVYKACMDEERIESAGLEPLLIKLRELGGWPVLEGDAWNQTGIRKYNK